MSDVDTVSSVISAGAGVAGILGGAIAFLWGRVEWNNSKIKRELAKCQAREIAQRQREHQIVIGNHEHRAALTIVIELLWQEIQRLSPDAIVLKRAKRLLDDLKDSNKDFRKER